ncbi:MAG: helix-turn-helix domain-containing protein [Rudanella sp.]|nr:helix-turn-helix domain-containing protein [Rudanella sp.]
MTFYFSAYSTPLLFGFVQGWVYAILLWVRGRREERLSDTLLGWVLVALCFDIWIYMLGFGGIEIFWKELEFFPRTLSWLLPPLVYFYLKSQFDTSFRFRPRDAWHALPFVLDTAYHMLVWAMGQAVVHQWEMQIHNPYLGMPLFLVSVAQQFLYLYWSLQLYRHYRAWIKTQFSETETISFRWFRNFLIALTITLIFGLMMTLIDLWLDLNYWQDWWGNLVGVILIYYVSITGYAQVQPGHRLTFRETDVSTRPLPVQDENTTDSVRVWDEEQDKQVGEMNSPALPSPEVLENRDNLLAYMTAERPYLEPELSLADLARRLHTNPVVLSQVINTGVGKNFNDFVNEYRVEEFKRQVREPANAHLSFLGLALDCGFNSKATFNRAFKKFTGASPKEFAET